MFPKIIQLDGHFEDTGEARCSIYDPRDRHLHKYASETALDYAGTLSPVPDRTIILVLAMSAGEYYGPNRNGDGFAERPVKVGDVWATAPGETLPDHHKTFEDHATVYKHHINKDPANNYGDVLRSFYNWNMHRVELFLSVCNDRAADIVGRIDGGEFPGVSMGCRIKYDVCSICGNMAPTTADYCHHVNNLDPNFGMNRLTPDGQRCFVWNPAPLLFDISFVFRPADRLGFTMKKVAHTTPYIIQSSGVLGQRVEDLGEKRALLQKISDIDKIIEGDIVHPCDTPSMPPEEHAATAKLVEALRPAQQNQPTLSMGATRAVSHHSLPEFASSFFEMGMMPTAVEIFRFICAQAGRDSDPYMEHQLSQTQGKVAAMLSNTPQVIDQLANMGLLKTGAEYARADVMQALVPLQEKRALAREYLARRVIPESIGPTIAATGAFDADAAYYTPTWQPLHWNDPNTGKTYETTRRAAERADLSNKIKELAELGGVAAATGAAYKVLSHRKPMLAAPALLAGAGAGKALYDMQKMPTVKTREGVDVPLNVEFVEKRSGMQEALLDRSRRRSFRSVGTPLVGGALLTAALLSDRASAEAPIEAQRALAWGRENPYKSLIGGTTATALLQNALSRAPSVLKSAQVNDPASLDPVDVDALFLHIGAALLR